MYEAEWWGLPQAFFRSLHNFLFLYLSEWKNQLKLEKRFEFFWNYFWKWSIAPLKYYWKWSICSFGANASFSIIFSKACHLRGLYWYAPGKEVNGLSIITFNQKVIGRALSDWVSVLVYFLLHVKMSRIVLNLFIDSCNSFICSGLHIRARYYKQFSQELSYFSTKP